MSDALEQEKALRSMAKEFRLLQKIFSKDGSFQNMKQATVCAGLAQVCEMLADAIKRRLI